MRRRYPPRQNRGVRVFHLRARQGWQCLEPAIILSESSRVEPTSPEKGLGMRMRRELLDLQSLAGLELFPRIPLGSAKLGLQHLFRWGLAHQYQWPGEPWNGRSWTHGGNHLCWISPLYGL